MRTCRPGQGVDEVLNLVLTQHGGPVIAPMTVIEPTYFDEIVGRLGRRGHDVRHFALLAARDTILQRLRIRGVGHVCRAGGRGSMRRETFAVVNVARCLSRLCEPHCADQVWTAIAASARSLTTTLRRQA